MRRRHLLFWAVAVAAGTVGALLLLRANLACLLTPCPLRAWTGIPCPTCGGTLAVRELADGHLLAAFVANPLVTLVITVLLMSGVAALIALPWAERVRSPDKPSGRLLGLLVASLVAANWIYLLFRYR